MQAIHQDISKAYQDFITNKAFPCIGAKTAMAKSQAHCMIAGHMACPADDNAILQFLYDFVDVYRKAGDNFHSAAIIFTGPENITEEMFEVFLWQKLQALSNLDSQIYGYDKRVSSDPASAEFSFSLKEEAFFIIGLHPGSSRPSRAFQYPALVFNPHAQFDDMRATGKYETIKQSVRKRDIIYSGSINPMLSDHGRMSETAQYSGKNYEGKMVCPLKIHHANK